MWNTRKQNTVAFSSTEAEYVSLAEASRDGLCLMNLLKELKIQLSHFTIHADNQSCIKLTKRFDHKRLKHIDVQYNFTRELVSQKLLNIVYVSTNDQTADKFTKGLCNVPNLC